MENFKLNHTAGVTCPGQGTAKAARGFEVPYNISPADGTSYRDEEW